MPASALLAVFASAAIALAYPIPSKELVAYQRMAVGAMVHIGPQIFIDAEDCNTMSGLAPLDSWNPSNLSTDAWVAAAKSFGATYAVFAAQHSCGFPMFPTHDWVLERTGFEYAYGVEFTEWSKRTGHKDLVAEFIESCRKYDVKPAIYYGLNTNYYLNVEKGKVQGGFLSPGQVRVTQKLYEKIVAAQSEQLWTQYGELFELWFDGGMWESLSDLAREKQPHAVYFQGVTKDNNIRWIGTESGEPTYPVWSTNDVIGKEGAGSPDGEFFNPAESDTTPEQGGHWFWFAANVPKTLQTLKDMYHATVGGNSNLALNVSPDKRGLVPSTYTALYQALGDWARECYGNPVASVKNQKGNKVVLKIPGGESFNRLSVSEDISKGQRVRHFNVTVNGVSVASGSSIGNNRIMLLPLSYKSTKVEIDFTESVDTPIISSFSAYSCQS